MNGAIYTRVSTEEQVGGTSLESQKEACLDRAKELAAPQDLILVCGSLFTVGEAMTYFDPDKYRPDGIL